MNWKKSKMQFLQTGTNECLNLQKNLQEFLTEKKVKINMKQQPNCCYFNPKKSQQQNENTVDDRSFDGYFF
jgi:hypothetical protein